MFTRNFREYLFPKGILICQERNDKLNHLPSQQLFYKFPATPPREFFWFLRVWVYSIEKYFAWTDCSIAYTWIQNINKFIICFYKLKSNWLESFYLLNDLVENGTTFLTLPESGWLHLTILQLVINLVLILVRRRTYKINSVCKKDSNACTQSIAGYAILNNHDNHHKNPVSDG